MQDERSSRRAGDTEATRRTTGGVLLVTDVRFWREAIGSQKRVSEMVRLLAEITAPVHVLFLGRPNDEDYGLLSKDPEHAGVLVADTALPGLSPIQRLVFLLKAASGRRANGSTDWLSGASALLRGKLRAVRRRIRDNEPLPPTLDEQVKVEWVSAFRDAVSRIRPQTLVIEYLRLGYLLDALNRSERTAIHAVVDTHDVMWRRDEAFRHAGLTSDLAIDKRTEAMHLRKFDSIVAIQSVDARVLQSMVPDRRVHVVYHASVIDPLPPAASDPMQVLFVASGMSSNVDALRHFLHETWPLVRAEARAKARVIVYGGVCEKLDQKELPYGVELRGFASNLRAAYQSASVVINPVQAGGGLKIKTVEALCYGRCLVTTPCGAEGLEDGAGTAFLTATSNQAFAAHLERLLGDRDLRVSFAGRAIDYARRYLSREVALASLTHALRKHLDT